MLGALRGLQRIREPEGRLEVTLRLPARLLHNAGGAGGCVFMTASRRTPLGGPFPFRSLRRLQVLPLDELTLPLHHDLYVILGRHRFISLMFFLLLEKAFLLRSSFQQAS